MREPFVGSPALYATYSGLKTATLSLVLLLLACQAVPSRAVELNLESLHEELKSLDDKHCMSVAQLQDALQLAAWKTTVHGVEERAVILTSCDLRCMRHLMGPFLSYLQAARGGPLSQHVVVVANGIPAFIYCDGLRLQYGHHCVMDLFCSKHAQKEGGHMEWTSPAYMYALLQKLTWALAVVELNTAVMWMDMDVVVFGNPLEFAYRQKDADFVQSAEAWEKYMSFKEDAEKWSPGDPWEQNGGLWLARPTPGGLGLMQMWVGKVLKEMIDNNGTSGLDQYILNDLIRDQVKEVPRMRRTPSGYVQDGVHKRPANLSLYRVNPAVWGSFCFGPCNGPSWRVAEASGWGHTDLEDERINVMSLPGYAGGPVLEPQPRLMCHMPREEYDYMITIHMNCETCLECKRGEMARYWNVTFGPGPPPLPPQPPSPPKPPNEPEQQEKRHRTRSLTRTQVHEHVQHDQKMRGGFRLRRSLQGETIV
mmetsp:Transcript_33779/g.74836  ORF Transcript_33779/g.74836 Transcript_33779/m.74836 type:complete len:480 (-) Transcript_33779:881-2320(-)|eukprot:CAMPEP_0202891248 /NCGR_PEP_ID=MMETSP1392-20130828/1358_1 /ASSEMBLY_ACC=CAM_ASM_000868 /TAXON_ID=225041 /ORGANISM="Chlamydomonas chlamydogama, Strain SAG 11-48b" /LENGTH=479 /DNA_ID=CAMNT_0049574943 /DNA_START=198 /DNA_END=1637 /DNA_ORIENTATION=+